MAALIAFLFLAVSVKQDQTPLRTACEADAETVAKLPAGADVTIRFALSGETPCYKVSAIVAGKELGGYVAASALEGLDTFDKGLREAAWVDVRQVLTAVRPTAPAPGEIDGVRAAAIGKQMALVDKASNLIEAGQPEKA